MAEKSNSIVDINDLKSLWRIFSKNWIILLVCILVPIAISFLYIHRLTDISAAKTKILIKQDQTYDYQTSIYSGLGFNYNSYEKIANEMRVVKSYNLIEKAIDRLDLEVSYFIVGRIKTSEMYETTPFKIKVNTINGSLYEVPFSLKIINENKYTLSYEKNGERISKEYFFEKETVNNDFKIDIKKTAIINANTIESLRGNDYQFIIHNKSNLVHKYQNNLFVENEEYTAILNLTVEDEIVQRAVTFLDTLSDEYINYTLQSQIDINENTITYIDRQLNEVVEILSEIEDDLESYKRDKTILDLNKEEAEYFKELTDYEGQRTKMILQYSSIEELEKYIIQGKDAELLPPSFYINNEDEFLKKSVSELYSMQISKNNEMFKSTVQNAPIIEIDQKIERLKNIILTYLSNTKIAVKQNIARLGQQVGTYKGSIQTLPQKQRQLLNIQRKLQVNEKMYLFLLEKKANTVIARAGIIPSTKVIEAARSAGVVKPDKSKIRYTFIGIGLVIALLIIFIRTAFFDTIESVEELKGVTRLPIMGEILYSPNGKESYIVVDSDPKSGTTESFRNIRTNLEYIAPEVQSKVILLTSNNPGEGKTFCSINLATIIAKAGKKVLIIELDLHKPKVQVGFNMKVEEGVSTVLIGRDPIENALKPTTIENLDVLLSGPTPPNASELIVTQKMAQLFEDVRKLYDYIIIDTPPVGLISDALSLMKYADICLFVVNTKQARKSSLTNAQEIQESMNIKNFSIILNGVKHKKSKYYNSRYGYGYGYGYGNEPENISV